MAKIFRVLGWFFLALAVFSLAFDLFSFFKTSSFSFSQLGENWFNVHAGSLNLLQAVTERYISPYVWDYGFSQLLFLPTIVVMTVLGGLFTILSSTTKKKKRHLN